jgi:hypothetical protein
MRVCAMIDGQNDAVLETVLETLKQIAAEQSEMRRNLQKLVGQVARIEERFDVSNKRLRRVGRRLKMWRDGERAMIADHAAAEIDLSESVPGGVQPLENPVPLPSGEPLIVGAEHEAPQRKRRGLRSAKQPPGA